MRRIILVFFTLVCSTFAQQNAVITMTPDAAHLPLQGTSFGPGPGSLARAIAAIPSGARAMITVPSGYKETLGGTGNPPVINIPATVNGLTIHGETGNLIQAGAGSEIMITTTGATGVTIDGLNFSTNGFSSVTPIYAVGTTNFTATNNIINDTTGTAEGISIGEFAYSVTTNVTQTGVYVAGNIITGVYDCVHLWDSDQVHIEHNRCINSVGDGFYENLLLRSFPNGGTLTVNDNEMVNMQRIGVELQGNGFRWVDVHDNTTYGNWCESLVLATDSGGTQTINGPQTTVSVIGKDVTWGSGPDFSLLFPSQNVQIGGVSTSFFTNNISTIDAIADATHLTVTQDLGTLTSVRLTPDQLLGAVSKNNSCYNTIVSPMPPTDTAYGIEVYGHNITLDGNHVYGGNNAAAFLYAGQHLSFINNYVTGSGAPSAYLGSYGFLTNVPTLAIENNTFFNNTCFNNQSGCISAGGPGDKIIHNHDFRNPGYFTTDSSLPFYTAFRLGIGTPTDSAVIQGNDATLGASVNGFSGAMPYQAVGDYMTGTGTVDILDNIITNQSTTANGTMFGGNTNTPYKNARIIGNTASNLATFAAPYLDATLGISYCTNNSVLGAGSGAAVQDFMTSPNCQLSASGAGYPTETVTFTPTTIGWYRILNGLGTISGEYQIYNTYTDNAVTDVAGNFYVDGYGGSSEVNQFRYNGYNFGIVDRIRASGDGGAAVYLDIHISSATTPTPITLYFTGYGVNGTYPSIVTSPVVGATVGSSSVSLLETGPGFRTTVPSTVNNYIAPGAGAITQTLQQKDTESLSVVDFGAQGDERKAVNCTITTGTASLNCADGNFTALDTVRYATVPMGPQLVAGGAYTSGGSISGTYGDSCSLGSFNGGGTGATATVMITAVSSKSFSGTGLNDLSIGGSLPHFTSAQTFVVAWVTPVGGIDAYTVAINGGSPGVAVVMDGTHNLLGEAVTFDGATTGHHVGDTTTFVVQDGIAPNTGITMTSYGSADYTSAPTSATLGGFCSGTATISTVLEVQPVLTNMTYVDSTHVTLGTSATNGFSGSANGPSYFGTDDSASVIAALIQAHASKKKLYFPSSPQVQNGITTLTGTGTYLLLSQIVLPSAATGSGFNVSPDVEIFGDGSSGNGNPYLGIPTPAPTTLDMRYTGVGAKFWGVGIGGVHVYDLGFTDYGMDSTPFTLFTNATPILERLSFFTLGTVKIGKYSDQDAIVLGGPTASNCNTYDCAFAGYGGKVADTIFFDSGIRRGLYGRTFANGIRATGLLAGAQSGSNLSAAFIECDGSSYPAASCQGFDINVPVLENVWHANGFRLTNASDVRLSAHLYDGTGVGVFSMGSSQFSCQCSGAGDGLEWKDPFYSTGVHWDDGNRIALGSTPNSATLYADEYGAQGCNASLSVIHGGSFWCFNEHYHGDFQVSGNLISQRVFSTGIFGTTVSVDLGTASGPAISIANTGGSIDTETLTNNASSLLIGGYRMGALLFSQLPASPVSYQVRAVSDLSDNTPGAIAASGGSLHGIVWYDTNTSLWYVGMGKIGTTGTFANLTATSSATFSFLTSAGFIINDSAGHIGTHIIGLSDLPGAGVTSVGGASCTFLTSCVPQITLAGTTCNLGGACLSPITVITSAIPTSTTSFVTGVTATSSSVVTAVNIGSQTCTVLPCTIPIVSSVSTGSPTISVTAPTSTGITGISTTTDTAAKP